MNNLYRDIYNLTTKLHFSPQYIESITPAERELFLFYAKEEQEKAEKDAKPKEMMLGTPIDPL